MEAIREYYLGVFSCDSADFAICSMKFHEPVTLQYLMSFHIFLYFWQSSIELMVRYNIVSLANHITFEDLVYCARSSIDTRNFGVYDS